MSKSTIMDPFSATKSCPLDLKIIFPIPLEFFVPFKSF